MEFLNTEKIASKMQIPKMLRDNNFWKEESKQVHDKALTNNKACAYDYKQGSSGGKSDEECPPNHHATIQNSSIKPTMFLEEVFPERHIRNRSYIPMRRGDQC